MQIVETGGRHLAARAVDVERDLFLGVLRLQKEKLRDDEVRDLIVDWRADEDDALLEESRVDVEGALPPTGVLDHHRDEVVGWRLHLVHVGHKRHSRHGLPGFSQEPTTSTR